MGREKKHKTDKWERHDESSPARGSGLKLVLKVGNSPVPEARPDTPEQAPAVAAATATVAPSPPLVAPLRLNMPRAETSVAPLRLNIAALSGDAQHKEKRHKKKKKKEKEKRHKKDRRADDGDDAMAASSPEAPSQDTCSSPEPDAMVDGHDTEPDEEEEAAAAAAAAAAADVAAPAEPADQPAAAAEQAAAAPTPPAADAPTPDATPAFRRLLEHILVELRACDKRGFFSTPVTDEVAPGYSSIIDTPMDLSTMATKVERDEYPDMAAFKEDFRLMCCNAMTYNRIDTIYYRSAKRLLHVGSRMMSSDKLLTLRMELPYVRSLSPQVLGVEPDLLEGSVTHRPAARAIKQEMLVTTAENQQGDELKAAESANADVVDVEMKDSGSDVRKDEGDAERTNEAGVKDEAIEVDAEAKLSVEMATETGETEEPFVEKIIIKNRDQIVRKSDNIAQPPAKSAEETVANEPEKLPEKVEKLVIKTKALQETEKHSPPIEKLVIRTRGLQEPEVVPEKTVEKLVIRPIPPPESEKSSKTVEKLVIKTKENIVVSASSPRSFTVSPAAAPVLIPESVALLSETGAEKKKLPAQPAQLSETIDKVEKPTETEASKGVATKASMNKAAVSAEPCKSDIDSKVENKAAAQDIPTTSIQQRSSEAAKELTHVDELTETPDVSVNSSSGTSASDKTNVQVVEQRNLTQSVETENKQPETVQPSCLPDKLVSQHSFLAAALGVPSTQKSRDIRTSQQSIIADSKTQLDRVDEGKSKQVESYNIVQGEQKSQSSIVNKVNEKRGPENIEKSAVSIPVEDLAHGPPLQKDARKQLEKLTAENPIAADDITIQQVRESVTNAATVGQIKEKRTGELQLPKQAAQPNVLEVVNQTCSTEQTKEVSNLQQPSRQLQALNKAQQEVASELAAKNLPETLIPTLPSALEPKQSNEPPAVLAHEPLLPQLLQQPVEKQPPVLQTVLQRALQEPSRRSATPPLPHQKAHLSAPLSVQQKNPLPAPAPAKPASVVAATRAPTPTKPAVPAQPQPRAASLPQHGAATGTSSAAASYSAPAAQMKRSSASLEEAMDTSDISTGSPAPRVTRARTSVTTTHPPATPTSRPTKRARMDSTSSAKSSVSKKSTTPLVSATVLRPTPVPKPPPTVVDLEQADTDAPLVKPGFLRQREDGTTSLAIVTPPCVDPKSRERPETIGQLTGQLEQGTTHLQGFREDARNIAKPVKPLYYGAYSSFAPSYDSTFATINKEESVLLFDTLAGNPEPPLASVRQAADECDMAIEMVDNLLDVLTSGQHRRSEAKLRASDLRAAAVAQQQQQARTPTGGAAAAGSAAVDRRRNASGRAARAGAADGGGAADGVDFKSLRSLHGLGIDVGFLDFFESSERQERETQQRLDHNAQLLNSLQEVQMKRLSQPPEPTPPPPSAIEVKLADELTGNLAAMVKKMTPGVVASKQGVRRALGIGPVLLPLTAAQPVAGTSPPVVTASGPREVNNAMPETPATVGTRSTAAGTPAAAASAGDAGSRSLTSLRALLA